MVDVIHAISILCPELAGMRDMMVQIKLDRVEMDGLVPIPRDFYRPHEFVTLTVDVMLINGIDFLATLFRKIRLFTLKQVCVYPHRCTVK